MNPVWLNGELTPIDAARIDPQDRGFLLGDGAFETMRVEAGELRRWPRHRLRLTRALEALEIAAPDWSRIETGIADLVQAVGLEAAVVRLTVSRGPLGGGMTARSGDTATVLATAQPAPERPSALSAHLVDESRRDVRNLSSRHKLTGYADMLGARRAAHRAGADIAIVLSGAGHVSSADSANLFWVKQGVVFTPALACGCLPGTTRAALIESLKGRGVAVEEGAYSADQLGDADWIFVTNAVTGLTPVAELNGRPAPAPGADVALFRAVCDSAL